MANRLDHWTHQYEAVFCIFLAVLAYLGPKNGALIYPEIFYLIFLLMAVNLLAGIALKKWPAREWISALIVCANNATITALMAYSGGRGSNLWVLYLLPIYTACLLLRGREVAWITAGAISFNASYFLLSIEEFDTPAYFELLLKSGIFVFSATITYKISQRDKSSRAELRHQSLKLEQAQKMEAIGRLAGGIAHDFNNLLTAILGSTHFLLESIPEKDHRFSDVRDIKDAALRAAALTHQLLAFSRRQTLQPKVVDLNAVIEDMKNILRRLIRADISFEMDLRPRLLPVKVDPGQIEQVIVNLVVNASDAMPDGGVIKIETFGRVLDRPEAHPLFSIPPGRYVVASVGDTGIGMGEETLSRIFEPFFTTKELGHGTGLGLSTVYGIVKQSGGYILVSSASGMGTTFKVHLPAATEPIDRGGAIQAETPQLNGSETILVVEDERQIRAMILRVLTRQGYCVLDAESAEAALRLAAEHDGAVDLLITDVVLPGCGGPELSRRLRATRPQTKVIFTSGYSDQMLLENEVIRNNLPFVPKPFGPEALLHKVRDVLSGGCAGQGGWKGRPFLIK